MSKSRLMDLENGIKTLSMTSIPVPEQWIIERDKLKTSMSKYRVKEVISKSGSYFQIQEHWFLFGWIDKEHPSPRRPGSEGYSYSNLEGAQNRIKRMQDVEPTKYKYHY